MYISLELPEYWAINHEDEKEGKYYISPNCNLKIFVHPSFYYIEDLLELAKTENIKLALETLHTSSKMKFYDMLNRDYEVDLLDMVSEMRENKNLSKAIKYTTMNEAFNDKEDKRYDDSYYYLNEYLKSEEDSKQELYDFRQKLIEKSNKTHALINK